MEKDKVYRCFTVIVFFVILISRAFALTDPFDVKALQDLYGALNSPPQLTGWRLDGGDPCEESWTGVSCSGSSVIHLKLQGCNLSGYLGGQLYNLRNLKYMDLSSNFIMGTIPYALPPNVTHIDLACNKLEQSIPYSLPNIKLLRHLNLSHNSLSGPIGNVFTGLQSLKEIDLSHNNFTNDLPSSFGSLTNLTRLLLQNNQFTGSVVYLAYLPLTDLNIQSNHFSGVIPTEFQSIPNLWIDGNRFHIAPNYPPWKFQIDGEPIEKNFSVPEITESNAIGYSSLQASGHEKKNLGGGGIACITGGVMLAVTCAAIFITARVRRSRIQPAHTEKACPPGTEVNPGLLLLSSKLGLGAPLSNFHTRTEKIQGKRNFAKAIRTPLTRSYTFTELQLATNNFSEENLLGDGTLGSVYKAEFPDGQRAAVKNINTVSLSFQEDEQFAEVVWALSQLRHPNIVALTGCCVEHGQHILVYEYIKSKTLEDVLHTEGFQPLSWTIRMDIALGVARALDCLHSTLSPPFAHGNLKAANVLLDENLIPHLSDSVVAVLKPLTSNSVKVKAAEIALDDTGYIAPEHGHPGADNTKSDVYAYGVLLLELLTGRRPYDSSRPRGEQCLAKWASSRLYDSEFLAQMVDRSIKTTISSSSLSQFAEVVSLCIQPERLYRPPMSEIVESLSLVVQKFDTATTGSPMVDVGTLEKSFRSAITGFMSSPTPSCITSRRSDLLSDQPVKEY